MSKENSEFWVEGSIEEIGDIIAIIRNDYIKTTPMELSRKIDIKVETIEKSEAGQSIHATSVLKKICDIYGLKYEILISKK